MNGEMIFFWYALVAWCAFWFGYFFCDVDEGDAATIAAFWPMTFPAFAIYFGVVLPLMRLR